MFATHKLNDNGFKEVAEFKSELSGAIKKVTELMPDGRDKAIFTTKLEEAVFFGTKAIASKTGNFENVQDY